ncbi:MAG: tetratricopeptide repeat protein, partial [Pseudomonadota bacterium]
VAVHILLLGIAAFAFRRATLLSFFILGFYVSLLPVSHIVPFGDVMAERFLYVPSMFFCLAVAWAIEKLPGLGRWRTLRWVLAGSLVVGYGAGSFRYSQAFASAPSLWSEMVARDPSHPKFQLNLGIALLDKSDWAGAAAHLRAAHDLDPNETASYLPLAQAYSRLGRIGEAGEVLREAVRRGPDYAETHRNYAVFQYDFGNPSIAQKHIRIARRLNPSDPDLEKLEAMILARLSKSRKLRQRSPH